MWISIGITVGMLAIGVVVWRYLQRREAADPELQRRFQADDRRAKAARERTARERQ